MAAERESGRRPILFGPFAFAPEDGELRSAGVLVPLQRQPALVLEYLLTHRGRIVSRDELIRHVWRDHHVNFDQSLNYCVRQVRLALADRAESPRYIETLPRKGYRWIAPIAEPAVIVVEPRPILQPDFVFSKRWLPAAALTLGLALLVTGQAVAPGDGSVPPGTTAGGHAVSMAEGLHALHVLAHAILEPERGLDAAGAVRTLRSVAAARLGLTPW